jgi:dethiobiotin synthetase/adenosylmethionine--8-amino-7-oxononanoate aminotransferase
VYKNWQYLLEYFAERGVRVLTVLPPPKIQENHDLDHATMLSYFKEIKTEMDEVDVHLDQQHSIRIQELDSMRTRAMQSIWWPFVQHGLVETKDVSVIDSAHGDLFHVYSPDSEESANRMAVQFDGSASWWTQSFGHSHAELAFGAARALGRYGHVMFPQAIHRPALTLAERLLTLSTGHGWASRVFISDNGSTAMEIAIKMALRAHCVWSGRDLTKLQKQNLGILGLKGSYHGDTIGAMDACDSGDGVYTCEWHNAKGYWFEPPSVGYRDGKPQITIPNAMVEALGLPSLIGVESIDWIYDVRSRINTDLCRRYRDYVTSSLANLQEAGMRIGALVLEPVLMGAGGMIFVDPLFQRVLVDVVRNESCPSLKHSPNAGNERRIPVIFDEVFVGLYRLGQESCATVLDVYPDIAVYAKTLTGGTIPLAATLASSSVFEAFYSENKSDALLHGHSYTAHAAGCEVANESLKLMQKVTSSSEWKGMQESWHTSATHGQRVWSFFRQDFLESLSRSDKVDWAMSLGTVLAFKVVSDGSGENA